MAQKERIDLLLAQQGLAPSREKARAYVMSGIVYADGQRVDKPGENIETSAMLEVRGGENFVSRGGQKLEKALETFEMDLAGCICADIGASTGGFTDCMLRRGARKVYAVDVGYGQLAWALRTDPRVVSLERTNARYLTADQIPDALDFFSVDVSFISLQLILPAMTPLLRETARGVCLIKPQFEAGRDKIGKNGVVRDAAVHIEVIENVLRYLRENGLCAAGLTFSPVRGPKGNIEYLVLAQRETAANAPVDIPAVVDEAHKQI